ncbi:hypothetical protein CcI49_13835 [Frankia sp. CcI49]|uniref:ABC transporter substrate-binding protein n=1 Tax=unclassified Frankia TaxID=2632575 RepID=UPI0006CA4233|nr:MULTISPECIES: ABC transporter substrate-binding protein [unclassified Frankia]KPM52464.1 hypothetical protein ACG83_29400 [Frankia sp. R43]ONH59819.1 hypothetical protein CcI49_13835 [Frankia sp. CcI49]
MLGIIRRDRLPRPPALAALAALALAGACAASDTGGSGLGRSACTSPGVSATEIRLGLLLSDTGPAAEIWQGMRSGIEARLGEVNEGGGVHGRKIVYSWRDDESNGALNISGARDLVGGAGVLALLEGSSVVGESAQYLDDQGVPVAGVAQEAAWSQHPNMISYANIAPPDTRTRDTLARYARAVGGDSAVVVIAGLFEASVQGGARITESLAAGGVPVVATLDYTQGASSPARLAQQIAATGADVLVSALPGGAFAEIYAAARQAGIPLRAAVSAAGLDQGLVDAYGTQISGAAYYTSVVPLEVSSPVHQPYLDAMARYAPGQSPDTKNALDAYITTDLLVQGLEAAGACPTREGLLTALRSFDAYDGGGLLSAPVDLTAGFGRPPACYTFVVVNQAGRGFEVAPQSPICPGAP